MPDPLTINDRITIPGSDLSFEFSRSGGPGGQHANTADTRVRLRLDLATEALREPVKRRLREAFPSAVTSEGDFFVVCDTHRSRHQNVEEARERLAGMVRQCLHPPKQRVRTKVSRSQKKKRLEGKRKRSEVKSMRKKVDR